MSIHIAIADDHPMIIDGLQNILPGYPDIILKGSYKNGNALLEGMETARPDVLLLDIQMPDLTGDELAPVLLKRYPGLKILVLTNFDSALYANNMFKRGAHGYLLKTAENSTLVEAIRTVYEGGRYLQDSMKEKIRQMSIRDQKASFSKSTLTPRELEILQLIVNGYSAPQIAEQCFLSLRTVVNYRTSIMLKLDVNNTAMLVKKALTTGLAE
ncbi:response regulator [Taibaiella koreensis]|uniref:response regulator n=1 Tax=Taibaiella koreensis TaxID=1268548 RepID=UPI000E59934B|nr:response regulator transcription factor [Taibaiella koreensis]